VELHHLHVLERDARAQRHRHPVAGAGVGVRRTGVEPAGPAGREDDRLRADRLQAPVEEVPRDHALAAVVVDDELPGEVLLVGPDVALHDLLIKDVHEHVTGDVRRVRGARLAGRSERTLRYPPVLSAREDRAPVLEPIDVGRRLVAEHLDRVLVAEVVGALDGVERVLFRVVVGGVAERRVDAALGGARVAPDRVDLGQEGDVRAEVEGLDGGAHSRAAGADDQHVVLGLHVLGRYLMRFGCGFVAGAASAVASRREEWQHMPNPLSDRFRFSQEVHEAHPLPAFFVARIVDDGYSELRHHQWATSERSLEGLGAPLMRSATPHAFEAVVVEVGESLVYLQVGGSFANAHVAARTPAAADEALDRLRELLPPPEPTASQDVPVMFWTYSPQGPMPAMRKIAVPEWSEIRENYTATTRAGLDALMQNFRPAHGGQLILWHGEVGTGKTFALRALAWEWRDWCQLHYVVDPDTFFGEHADYLMSVLMQSGGLGASVGMMMATHPGAFQHVYSLGDVGVSNELDDDFDEEFVDGGADQTGQRRHLPWRLLVLEDTGELLRPDAKSIIGQGLSRFLNVVDGLIGQGLRVLVLVTTNEEIGTLHPAVARPGRAAANIEFPPLTRDEASAWLQQRGVEARAPAPPTLASLYALLEGRDPTETRAVGFGEVNRGEGTVPGRRLSQ
jgi:hypothetical protein